jgi:zinc transporter ZupT
VGIGIGVSLGQARFLTNHVAAAGGGLLLGISLFWLTPEIALSSGWWAAIALTGAACLTIAVADRLLLHSEGSPRHLKIGSVLAATSIHSFLDGWSVQALESLQFAGVAAPLGLALHKIPEGVAIGWIARRSLNSHWKAAAVASAVELMTIVGALIEPVATRSGLAMFGGWWTSAVLAIVSGSFLFLGVHAVLPHKRKPSIMFIFAATLAIVAAIGMIKEGKI